MGVRYHDKKINILLSLKKNFGKKNIADRTAWNLNRKGGKPSFILKESHFKNLKLI